MNAAAFRRKLMAWYRAHARKLPWRGVDDPYKIWVSEIMLQQTRVAAVIDHYHRFLDRFPTLASLAEASESDILAAWSGLGYYRRARMMHQAAQYVQEKFSGELPRTSAELRHLRGIGDYTSAAIASIAYGESVAVLDGNVERVLLRIAGRPEDVTAAGKTFLRQLAAELVPRGRAGGRNAPGDHNQAMMELGATICLSRNPLCLQCPVYPFCKTRGEHLTTPRGKARAKQAAYLLALRGEDANAEVLLELRSPHSSLMPGMYELPPLLLDAPTQRKPILRLRHSITDTVYAVEIHTPVSSEEELPLLNSVPSSPEMLRWTPLSTLSGLPLTGLARKVLRRQKWMS